MKYQIEVKQDNEYLSGSSVYEVESPNLEDATQRLYNTLKNFGFTKEDIRQKICKHDIKSFSGTSDRICVICKRREE